MAALLFLSIITIVLILVNVFVVKVTGDNKKKRIIAGVLVFLLAPVVFAVTLFSVGQFDEGGFATGLITVIYTTSFVVNGMIIIVMGLFK